MSNELYRHSIEIIRGNQHASGAYIASPNFPTYHYSWLRDGSFIAHAMTCSGEYASARAFFQWVHGTLQTHAHKVDAILAAQKAGLPLADADFLHTRYTLEGVESQEEGWGNFQYDGYGTWLWALGEYSRRTSDRTLLAELAGSVVLTARYLVAVWQLPGFDCWEEHPDYLHPYSLAAASAGLKAAISLAQQGVAGLDVPVLQEHARAIEAYVRAYGIDKGIIAKMIEPGDARTSPRVYANAGVDSSLIALATPYMLFAADDPLYTATLAQIEADLHRPGGGVYRYLRDTYYGGGEWVLLTAWLGWHYAKTGRRDEAQQIVRWIEAQANDECWLPEQVSTHVLDATHLEPWRAKWGPNADPLLWSHAMYLILVHALEENA